MTTPADLRFVVDALARKPFGLTLTVLTLHDHTSHSELLQIIESVVSHICEGENCPLPLPDFALGTLAYSPPAPNTDLVAALESDCDRDTVIDFLHFLLKDIDGHTRKAYVARFCTPMDQVPHDFVADEVVSELLSQLQLRQEAFIPLSIQFRAASLSKSTGLDVMFELKKLESEKQLVHGKIQRLQFKVDQIPSSAKWIKSARELRLEMQMDENLDIQQSDMRERVFLANNLFEKVKRSTANRALLLNSRLDGLAQDVANKRKTICNLPSEVQKMQHHVADLQAIFGNYSTSETVKVELEVDAISEEIKDLVQQRQSRMDDDKFGIFRQQATVVAARGQEATTNLEARTLEFEKLSDKESDVRGGAPPRFSTILRGDQFKQYVSELRVKSNLYKTKRQEMASLTAQELILQQTRETLDHKRVLLQRKLQAFEQKHGISGYSETKAQLELISERKGDLDQKKEDSMHTISELVRCIIQKISEKKTILAPVINELKVLRANLNKLDDEHSVKKREFDNILLAVETEIAQLEANGFRLEANITDSTVKLQELIRMVEDADTSLDKILVENKAQGGDQGASDMIVKACGATTWSDHYERRFSVARKLSETLQEKRSALQVSLNDCLRQQKAFQLLEKFLALRRDCNAQVLNANNSKPKQQQILGRTEQRLIVS